MLDFFLNISYYINSYSKIVIIREFFKRIRNLWNEFIFRVRSFIFGKSSENEDVVNNHGKTSNDDSNLIFEEIDEKIAKQEELNLINEEVEKLEKAIEDEDKEIQIHKKKVENQKEQVYLILKDLCPLKNLNTKLVELINYLKKVNNDNPAELVKKRIEELKQERFKIETKEVEIQTKCEEENILSAREKIIEKLPRDTSKVQVEKTSINTDKAIENLQNNLEKAKKELSSSKNKLTEIEQKLKDKIKEKDEIMKKLSNIQIQRKNLENHKDNSEQELTKLLGELKTIIIVKQENQQNFKNKLFNVFKAMFNNKKTGENELAATGEEIRQLMAEIEGLKKEELKVQTKEVKTQTELEENFNQTIEVGIHNTAEDSGQQDSRLNDQSKLEEQTFDEVLNGDNNDVEKTNDQVQQREINSQNIISSASENNEDHINEEESDINLKEKEINSNSVIDDSDYVSDYSNHTSCDNLSQETNENEEEYEILQNIETSHQLEQHNIQQYEGDKHYHLMKETDSSNYKNILGVAFKVHNSETSKNSNSIDLTKCKLYTIKEIKNGYELSFKHDGENIITCYSADLHIFLPDCLEKHKKTKSYSELSSEYMNGKDNHIVVLLQVPKTVNLSIPWLLTTFIDNPMYINSTTLKRCGSIEFGSSNLGEVIMRVEKGIEELVKEEASKINLLDNWVMKKTLS